MFFYYLKYCGKTSLSLMIAIVGSSCTSPSSMKSGYVPISNVVVPTTQKGDSDGLVMETKVLSASLGSGLVKIDIALTNESDLPLVQWQMDPDPVLCYILASNSEIPTDRNGERSDINRGGYATRAHLVDYAPRETKHFQVVLDHWPALGKSGRYFIIIKAPSSLLSENISLVVVEL